MDDVGEPKTLVNIQKQVLELQSVEPDMNHAEINAAQNSVIDFLAIQVGQLLAQAEDNS
ncbi:hypothetical protein [Periweissella cryptocerci]|uniref:hypothetical protein n=1 Tax=Periweissella cryptocerci TaxID=2506420 RepID=UPI0014043253|nr:hypothetical protein [Periweissella cryptocerci]